MKEILRNAEWRDEDGNSRNSAYEISRDGDNVYLATLTAWQGGVDEEIKLDLGVLDGLLDAYDGGMMAEWMYDNAEMLYRAERVRREVVS